MQPFWKTKPGSYENCILNKIKVVLMLNAINQGLGTVEKIGGNLAKLDLF